MCLVHSLLAVVHMATLTETVIKELYVRYQSEGDWIATGSDSTEVPAGARIASGLLVRVAKEYDIDVFMSVLIDGELPLLKLTKIEIAALPGGGLWDSYMAWIRDSDGYENTIAEIAPRYEATS